ncbi:hypothetical protein [Candidatus Solincola sp.]|nr:hypothetical protein [Actinomycetota bacterium]MDI7252309.1 hypothetical protein [Actinomycetota bacterium]
MKGKALVITAVLALAVMVAAGVAVAATSAGGERRSGCPEGMTKAGVLSRVRTGEAGEQATRNEGEESRIRAENCLEEMSGECAGQCERSTERLHERAEDGACPEECPHRAEECPMYGNGAPENAGVSGNGAAFTPFGSSGTESGQSGDCDMRRDRLHARDRDCTA